MSDKQAALEAIQRMPEGITFREITREMEFLAAVQEGEMQADQGKLISLEQVEQNLQRWLSKSS